MLIDPFDHGWLRQLYAFPTSGLHTHLLLDGAFVPGLHHEVRRCSTDGGTINLLFEELPGCNDEVRDASPFLVTCAARNPAMDLALTKCEGLPMVHAISSAESTVGLATRLARWCAIEADHQRFNFRFPDTRRLPGIFAALSREQRSSLIGPMSHWRYIARNGSWAELDLSSIERGVKPERELFESGCLLLSPEQFAVMVDDGDADSTLLLLGDRGLSWPLSQSEAHARVDGALAVARRASLEEFLQLDWCEACLGDASLLDAARQPDAIRLWRQSTNAGRQLSIV